MIKGADFAKVKSARLFKKDGEKFFMAALPDRLEMCYYSPVFDGMPRVLEALRKAFLYKNR